MFSTTTRPTLPGSAAGFYTRSIHTRSWATSISTSHAAAANYTALQARLERRFANGFTGPASYTFQQTLTDLDVSSVGVAVGAGAGLQTIKDIHAN